MCCFEASVQLVPKFYSQLVQLVPKNISKVKLSREQSPTMLSEMIKSQENGSQGRNFSTGTFTKG